MGSNLSSVWSIISTSVPITAHYSKLDDKQEESTRKKYSTSEKELFGKHQIRKKYCGRKKNQRKKNIYKRRAKKTMNYCIQNESVIRSTESSNKLCIDMEKLNENNLAVTKSTTLGTFSNLNRSAKTNSLEKEVGIFNLEDDIIEIRCMERSSKINLSSSSFKYENGKKNQDQNSSINDSKLILHRAKKRGEIISDENEREKIAHEKCLIPRIPYLTKDMMKISSEIEVTNIVNLRKFHLNKASRVNEGVEQYGTKKVLSSATSTPLLNSFFRPMYNISRTSNQEQQNPHYFFPSQKSQKNQNVTRGLNGMLQPNMARNYLMNVSTMVFQGQRLSSIRNIQEQNVPFLLDEEQRDIINDAETKRSMPPSTESVFLANITSKNDNIVNQSSNKGTKHGKQESGSKKKLRAAEQTSPYMNNTACEETMRSKKKLRTISIPSPIRLCHGVKVTMIDEAKKIFVIDLLNEKTCTLIRNIAEDYIEKLEKTRAAEKNSNQSSDVAKGWRNLYTYTKMDLPCSEVKGLAENITNRIMENIVRIVGDIYGKNIETSSLKPRSWKEPHLLKYQKYDGVMPHTGVEIHYDGCDITWQAMLTRQDEYEGGGTYIRCIQKTVKLQLGQILVHPGELYHSGVDITHGTRFLLVCFMDGFDPKIIDESRPDEDKEEYEKNVVIV